MRILAKITDYSSKNTFRVDVENVQTISKASLEFVQGINIIVGQSNSGKSAILRAVKGSVLNPSGSQKYIKNKTKGFKVNIDYAGNNIEWSREKSPKYIVNGEEYKKTGNSNLTDLVDNSGFVLDEDKNLMNIESELELPFPFDKSNSELFKLFEKTYNGEEPNDFIDEIRSLKFSSGESPEALIKTYKWIWGQEDVNYPNKLGRAMSWEGFKNAKKDILDR